jgi:hypothetical protein
MGRFFSSHPIPRGALLGNTPTVNTKLIIGTRNSRNVTKEMISKRPRMQQTSAKPQPKTN